MIPLIKHGRESVMVCGCFAVGDLMEVKGINNKKLGTRYHSRIMD